MTFNTRILLSEDLFQYKSLRLQSFRDEPFAFSESYEDECSKSDEEFLEELKTVGNPPECFVLGAFAADQLIGFVKFRRDQRSKARHKAMIHAMYVDPEYRKFGVGKLLVNACISSSKKQKGLEQIHLWVLHAESSVSEFYLRCGFKSQGTIVKGDLKIGDHYVDAEYMVLYL